MLTDFKQETTNTTTMAPGIKNIIFEIVDDVDEFCKNGKSNENTEKPIYFFRFEDVMANPRREL